MEQNLFYTGFIRKKARTVELIIKVALLKAVITSASKCVGQSFDFNHLNGNCVIEYLLVAIVASSTAENTL
jgi:hypothetical protein